MGRIQHHVEQLVIPVAGAVNYGHGRLSTAAPHLGLLRQELQADGDRVVTQAIVPDGFGVLHSLGKTYLDYLKEVDKLADPYPNAEIVLVGHSLGGLLARKQASEHLGRLRGVITLASPHDGLNPGNPFVPAPVHREYREFAQNTGPSEVPMAFIGSRYDKVVPLESALAPIGSSVHHEVSHWGPLRLGHNAVPVAPPVTSLAGQIVDELFGLPAASGSLASLPRPA